MFRFTGRRPVSAAVALLALLLLLSAAAGCAPMDPLPVSGPESSASTGVLSDPESLIPIESELPPEPSVEPSEVPSEDEPSEETPDPGEGTVLTRSVTLPASSSEPSAELARQLLGFCSGGTKDITTYVMESAGFETLMTSGYDKSAQDDSHTCAYVLGKGTVRYGDAVRPLFLISVRGTNGAEWYSNFNFAPSHDNSTAYAENFLACAQDVYDGIDPYLRKEENPLIAVCGHSRGAACANLLGVLLNRSYPVSNTFVYTFATPTTVRKEHGFDNAPHTNIFNYLNPADIVTKLPLEGWGFGRAGTDIVLDADAETVKKVDAAVAAMLPLAPTISDYYTLRHALSSGQKDKDGKTTYEVMCALSTGFFQTGGGLPAGLAGLDDSSVYYPVVTYFTGSLSAGGASVSNLMQHMPATYMLKIKQLDD